MDRFGATFEVKAVDDAARLIEGFAAVFSNVDRVGDIVDPRACDRFLSEKQARDVAVFVGHKHDDLPVGECLAVSADNRGLLTKTYVLPGPLGDQLLSAARKGLLGLSIGYLTRDARREQVGGKTVRRLLDIDVAEYSFAARSTIANPKALVTSVKTEGRMPDLDSLPDSAFAFVEPGALDTEQKTIPRANRHFAHHGPDGVVDSDLVRAAIDAAQASPLAEKALPHLLRHAAAALTGAADDAHEERWSAGMAGQLLVVVHGLSRLAERIAEQHKAMIALGDETKAGWATRATTRQELRELTGQLTSLIERAEGASTGVDASKLGEWWRLQRELLEV